MWFDRLLMILEVLVLLWMVRMDHRNSRAIQEFLKQRELWYARRAHQPKTTPTKTNPTASTVSTTADEPSETVELLKESETEQLND